MKTMEQSQNFDYCFSPVDQLARNIPSIRLREIYFTKKASPGVLTSSEEVDSFFCRIETAMERTPSPATRAAIKFHQSFRRRPLSKQDLDLVDWYFDHTNPHHVSWTLTNQGRDKSLWNAASNYKEVDWNQHQVDPWKQDTMLLLLSHYQSGQTLPAVILSSRPFGAKPDGHLHIIDGVHRLLALSVHILEGGNHITQEAFIA